MYYFRKINSILAILYLLKNKPNLLLTIVRGRQSTVRLCDSPLRQKNNCAILGISKLNINDLITITKLYFNNKKFIEYLSDFRSYLMIKMNDGSRWLIRKIVAEDMIAGPLMHIVNEPREWQFCTNIINKSSIFVDVGAYVGGYAVRACLLGARVVALEPYPPNFKILKYNLHLNNCIRTIPLQIAAGAAEGIRPLYYHGGFSSYSLVTRYSMNNIFKKLTEVGKVSVKPLDDVLYKIIHNDIIDLMKIDVEGAEIEVLKGAKRSLKNTKYLIIEIHQINRELVLRKLHDLGFKVIDIIFHYPNLDHTNYILENKNL